MQTYVLVQTESRTDGVARDPRAVPGVILAEGLSGPYDAIALAQSDSSGRPLEGEGYKNSITPLSRRFSHVRSRPDQASVP
jgi:hypothetical protein